MGTEKKSMMLLVVGTKSVWVSSSLPSLHKLIHKRYFLSNESYYLVRNGKKIDTSSAAESKLFGVVHVVPRLLGGKGGFGSMLRAIGAQIEKTTNREACRDLSGRRLRDINEEQRLKNWISQQADREREAAEKKQKKLERLCQEPKHEFKDEKYDDSRSSMTEKMSNSVELGFKASTSGQSGSSSLPQKNSKRKSEADLTRPLKKKKKLWIDPEDSDASSLSESEEVAHHNKIALE